MHQFPECEECQGKHCETFPMGGMICGLKTIPGSCGYTPCVLMRERAESNGFRLNLGCGNKLEAGWHNVDLKAPADEVVNLCAIPWPWPDNSVEEVRIVHTLEHLGHSPEFRLAILQELYRVCKHGAKILVIVPHPRHDHYINDPTHCWPVTPGGLELFDQAKNRKWIEQGYSNSTLGLDHGVDLRLVQTREIPDPAWEALARQDWQAFQHAARHYYNVITQYEIELVVQKHNTKETNKDNE
jgi:SAM-dependent methyltransferase